MLTLLLLLSAQNSIASPRGEPSEPRFYCPPGPVNACIAKHQEELQSLQAWIAQGQARIQTTSAQIDDLKKIKFPLDARQQTILSEIEYAKRELSFLETQESNEEKNGVLDGEISLSELFRIPARQAFWGERYPEERATKLTETIANWNQEEADIKSRLAKISPLFASANDDYQAALAQQNNWLGMAKRAEGMCRGGCRAELCPPQN